MNGSDTTYIVSWMSLGDPVIVISKFRDQTKSLKMHLFLCALVGTLILNLFIYKCINEQNRASIITIKLIIGMCCAVIAMCIAGGIEIWRQKKCHSGMSEE